MYYIGRKQDTYCVDRISDDNHDNGHGTIYKGERAMFQLSSHDTFAVHVSQFLHFLQK